MSIVDGVSINLGRAIRYGCLAFCIYEIQLGATSFAGKTTLASFFFRVFGNLRISIAVSWVLAGTATAWAVLERKLRKSAVRKKANRIRFLESISDPNRSSSGLMPDGSTRPEDEK